jgi:hypothetical protein
MQNLENGNWGLPAQTNVQVGGVGLNGKADLTKIAPPPFDPSKIVVPQYDSSKFVKPAAKGAQ